MGQEDAALIDRFLEMMAAERGASRNTLLAYRTDLTGAGGLLGGLAGASKEGLGTLATHWASLAGSSVARKASALRAFYGFLEEEGLEILWPYLEPRCTVRDRLDPAVNTRPYESWSHDYRQGDRLAIHISNVYKPKSPLAEMKHAFAAALIEIR